MRKSILPFLGVLFIVFNLKPSVAQISFINQYGGTYDEEGRWMEQTADSGFIMVGGTTTYSVGQNDIWLVKTDAYGNEQWRKSKGGTDFDFANMVKITSDGGYIIAGFTESFGAGGNDGYLVKTDASGNTQWTETYGDGGEQEIEAIIQTSDGGYACVGINNTNGTGYYDVWLFKTDASGDLQWQRNIGGGSYDIGNSIQETPDGGFIIAGQTYSYGTQTTGDYYLVKTNSSGIVQWSKTYGTGHLCDAHYVQNVPGGGYILVGDADTTNSGFGDADLWAIRTNANGDSIWSQTYGGTKKDGGKTIEPTTDGGYIIGGITRSFNVINPDYYLVKTDSGGIIEWTQHYGLAYHDHGYRAIETSDGGYAIFGYFRNQGNNYNYGLVKIGPGGGVTKDIAVDRILTPTNTICSSAGSPINVLLTNYGGTNESNVVVYFSATSPGGTTVYQDTLTGSLPPSTSIVLTFDPLFNSLITGTYSLKAYIIHRSGDISYANDTITSTLIVVAPSGDPVTSSAIACAGPASLILSASGADSLFWYDSATGGNLVNAGPSFTTPSLNSTTSYYVENHKGKGDYVGAVNNAIGGGGYVNGQFGLNFDSRKPFKLISVLVYADNNGVRTIELRDVNDNLLQSGSFDLVTGSQRVYLNFDIPQENDLKLVLGAGSESLFRNNSGASYTYDVSQTVEIYSPTAGNLSYYYYFYDWYVFVPYQNCASNRIPVTATIGTSNTTVFDQSRCGNGPVTFTASSSGSLSWYDDATGGNLLVTGTTYTTPSLSTTTTYYLEVNGCTPRIAVQAIINQTSTAPVANDVIHCGPGIVTLTATATDPVYWYNAPTGGNLVGSGSPFDTPYLTGTTTYYVQAGSVCPSARVAVQAIINSATAPVGNDVTACGPISVTLSATSSDSILWFDAPVGGNQVGAGTTFDTPVLTVTTTYYAEAQSACVSVRTPVTANITTVDDPLGVDGSHCGPGVIVISASAVNPVSWFEFPTGGTVLSTGINFTTPFLTTTTTYYAEASDGTCLSARIPVVATVVEHVPPVTTSGFSCGPGAVTITATASDTVYWFSDLTGGILLGSGNSYTTPVISTTTIYYAQTTLACPSPRAPVDAEILSTTPDPVTTNVTVCSGDSAILTIVSTDSITWYDDLGNVVGAGTSFTTPVLTAMTIYFATAGIQCPSSQVADTVFVDPSSADPVTTSDSVCGSGSITLTATATDSVTWYDDLGNVVGTGNSFTTPILTTTTTYYAIAMDHCASNAVPAVAIVNAISADPVTTGASSCGPGSVILSASSTDSITWYDDLGNVVGTGSTFTTPVLGATTTYFAVAGISCPSSQIAAIATIYALPIVNLGPDSIQTFTSTYPFDAGPGFVSYLWNTGETTQSITVNGVSGTYCVTVTDTNGCTGTDCSYIDFIVGFSDPESGTDVMISPNPASSFINLVFNSQKFSHLQVTDVEGRIVIQKEVTGKNGEVLEVSSLAKGIYFLRLQGEVEKNHRIIIE